MFLLGLLLPTCYVTLWTGVSVPTQWPLLSIMLPILIWRKGATSLTFLHYLGLGFVIYSVLGVTWAPHVFDTGYGLWLMVLWCLSFQLGYVTDDPRSLMKGLAWGLAIQMPLVIAQYFFGWQGIDTYGHMNIAGVLYNRTVIGALSAMVILSLAESRLWYHIPALLPGLILCGSRGGWIALAVGALSRIHWILPLAALLFGVVFMQDLHDDPQRLLIWGLAIRGWTWVGYSIGSFQGIYYINPHEAVHAEFVHNDYIQLIFELGIFAAIPFTIFATAMLWRPSPTLWAFAALGCFYFPLENPTTAFLGLFAMGYAIRGITLDGFARHLRGLDFIRRDNDKQSSLGRPRQGPIPAFPRLTS